MRVDVRDGAFGRRERRTVDRARGVVSIDDVDDEHVAELRRDARRDAAFQSVDGALHVRGAERRSDESVVVACVGGGACRDRDESARVSGVGWDRPGEGRVVAEDGGGRGASREKLAGAQSRKRTDEHDAGRVRAEIHERRVRRSCRVVVVESIPQKVDRRGLPCGDLERRGSRARRVVLNLRPVQHIQDAIVGQLQARGRGGLERQTDAVLQRGEVFEDRAFAEHQIARQLRVRVSSGERDGGDERHATLHVVDACGNRGDGIRHIDRDVDRAAGRGKGRHQRRPRRERVVRCRPARLEHQRGFV